MPTATFQASAVIGGLSLAGTISRTASGQIGQQTTLAVAWPGSLTTRTSDTAGVITMTDAGHLIVNGTTVDVYWDGGSRYGVAASVSGTAVTLATGTGDVLPAQDTAMIVSTQVALDVDFDGDLLNFFVAHCAQRGHLEFFSSSATIAGLDLASGELLSIDVTGGATNPLASATVAQIFVSNASTTATAVVSIGILYDSLS